MPPVAGLGHAAQRDIALASPQYRQAGALSGLGVQPERRQPVEPPLEAHGVGSPAGLQDADRLLHAGPAILEGLPQQLELLFEPPRAHAEDHPPAGEGVQGRHRLGHDQGRPQRKDQDRGAEPDPAGHRAHPGQRGERIEVRDGRRPGGLPVRPVGVRAGRLFGNGDVIGDPERRVPDRFRERRDRHQGVGRGQRPRGEQRDPVLHARGGGVGAGNVLP